ncbi:MAG: transcription-repair coupling factor [Planctomycetes bacterium]|nr:transcription-repair coupling factor [Planctomycetota bacterium]
MWGAGSALITAALARPALVLVAEAPEEMLDDLAVFGARATLLPEADAGPLAFADRVRTAHRFLRGEIRIMVATAKAALQELPAPRTLEATRVRLTTGERLDLARLSQRLVESRYERTHAVELPGEYAIRGGIVDIFPFTSEYPTRIELFGDAIESIREFTVADQTSRGTLGTVEFSLLPERDRSATVVDYLAADTLVVVREPGESRDRLHRLHEGKWDERFDRMLSTLSDRPVLTLQSLPVAEAAGVNVRMLSLQRFSGQLSNIAQELESLPGRIHLFCANEGEEERLRGLLRDAGVKRADVEIHRGRLSRGFAFEEIGTSFVSNHELFNRYRLRRPLGRRQDARPIDSLLELERGDTVVHLYHGIGRFLGIERLDQGEFVALEYADSQKLYVPVANIDLIQKYLGGSDHAPPLHKIGSSAWSIVKARAEKATEKLAQEMLQVQAVREMELGIAYPPDTDWQRAFEAAFPYEDTEDQVEVTRQVKLDMQSARPMDRLICGDVGYGKTELAMRAAFKAATAAKQVAVLVPTTVLAQQHYQTFSERMRDYPVAIDVLSRFKSKAEQRETLGRLAQGQIDVIIGTHRLLQSDVRFKDLGLVVVDEEQRFGVEHKERFKQMRATVDVLTLTATPIPRTMHMSLLGIRDISALSTPPQDRMAIHTEVMMYDERRIREAILFELDRGGQVYFVHNRVHNIDKVRRRLERLVPEATFGIGHGQMDVDELERTMIDFLERKVDVLVATTIIESGLDIPNVNTILINNADQFGLADLHQLRGRVGRYKVQAYCHVLLPVDRPILSQAAKRIKAIEEFSELGSGFKIAMRDLEIRGVGNLLGREQHGHIAAIGFDLYVKMLQRAMKKARRQPIEDLPDASVELGIDAAVPEAYVPELRSRVEAYRRIAGCRTAEELEAARREVVDRFGPPPESVENFVKVVRVRQLAQRWRLTSVARVGDVVVTKYVDRKRAEEMTRRGDVRIVDGETLHVHGAWTVEGLIRLMEA